MHIKIETILILLLDKLIECKFGQLDNQLPYLLPYLIGLFYKHAIKKRHDPILKFAIVIIWHQQIADAVQALGTKLCTRQREFSSVCWCQAFYQILFYAPSCPRHHINLYQVEIIFIEKYQGLQVHISK